MENEKKQTRLEMEKELAELLEQLGIEEKKRVLKYAKLLERLSDDEKRFYWSFFF